VLSLRGVDLITLRSLAGLSRLRVLHLDGAYFGDLRPLSKLASLEELTFDGAEATTVEPLRALATGGRLRKVSARGNCLTSCEALAGIEHDCSEARNGCPVSDSDSFYHDRMGTRVDDIESYAPDLPVWNDEQIARAFELMRNEPAIDWKSVRSACNDRATASVALLKSAGFPAMTKVVSMGNLRALAPSDPAGFAAWDWHVTVAVRGEHGFIALDPALDDTRPMTLRQWFARQIDSAGSPLDFSCLKYTGSAAMCAEPSPVDVDEKGILRVDTMSDLRGTLCPDTHCLGG
jgi:hypothetical protein